MPSNNRSSYVTGSTARKFEYLNDDYPIKQKKQVKKKTVKKAVNMQKVRSKTVLVISCLFVMLMIITYRFNIISESNLTLQTLRNELERVQSNLAATEMDVKQSTDLAVIEAYAKQKLGMQKPDKNQVVYIDTSKETSVIKETTPTFVDKIIESIKEYINNIK